MGAGSGLIAVVIAILSYRRDRPKLEINWTADASLPWLDVTVVNSGRQPIALADVSLRERPMPLRAYVWRWIGPLRRPFWRWRPSVTSARLNPDAEIESPIILRPGDPYATRIDAGPILALARALGGRPTFWLVASDALGHEASERIHPDMLEVLELAMRGR